MEHFRQKKQEVVLSSEDVFNASGLFCYLLVEYVWFAGWSVQEESQAITGRLWTAIL